MTFRRLLWLGPILLLFHNLEEYLTMLPYIAAVRELLPDTLANRLAGFSQQQFAVSLAIVTVAAFAIAWVGARSNSGSNAMAAAVGFQVAAGLANGLQHTGQAVWMGGYASGAATGLALLVPYSIWLFVQAAREGWVAPRRITLAGAAWVVLMVPGLLGVHWLSSRLIGA